MLTSEDRTFESSEGLKRCVVQINAGLTTSLVPCTISGSDREAEASVVSGEFEENLVYKLHASQGDIACLKQTRKMMLA